MTTGEEDPKSSTSASLEAAASPKPSSGSGSSSEFEPPLACVRRMLKNTLPSNTNVGKDASFAFSRACGIFIVYLTACANDFARENKRQTITANDILAAVKELDFDEFSPQLTSFIEQHRVAEKKKKADKARALKEREEEEDQDQDDNDNDDDDDQSQKSDLPQPSPKRRKLSSATADDNSIVEDADNDDENAALNETMDDQDDNDSQEDIASQGDDQDSQADDEDDDISET